MWMFTTHGFFSVVRVSKAPMADVVIRARDKAALKKLADRMGYNFKIIETTDSDYRFRVVVRRNVWIAIAGVLAEDIDYTNFKEKVGRRNQVYSDLLYTVWHMVRGAYVKPHDGGGQ